LLYTTDGHREIAGFLMPNIGKIPHIVECYHLARRLKKLPLFNYYALHCVAYNLAKIFRAVHDKGYVVGDVNEMNIMVNPKGLVALIDTDSFQVKDSNTVYRCVVKRPEFTPPELQDKDLSKVNRKPEHDYFGLAVMIFQLLMEGTHPYGGAYKGSGDPPPFEEQIKSGHFTYCRQRKVPYNPSRLAPPFGILHPELWELFIKCFEEGHNNPGARPDAMTWQNGLNRSISELKTCSANAQHRFGSHLTACPWCQRKTELKGLDPFPSEQVVQRGEHLGTRPAQRTTPTRGPVVKQPPKPQTTTGTTRRPPRVRRRQRAVNVWSWIALASSLVALTLVSFLKFGIVSIIFGGITGIFSGICGIRGWIFARKKPGRNRILAYLPLSLLVILSMTFVRGFISIIPPSPPPSPPVHEMVLIPAGEFLMGSDEFDDEKPVHKVYLDDFYIDKYEVTNAQYKKFMDATGHKKPRYWDNPNYNAPDKPVVGVSWEDAAAYARWAGKRLPTEAEWEKAARGGLVGKRFVWGDEWPPPSGAGNFDIGDDGYEYTAPVGKFKPNGYGLYDMAGNVWEWCGDWYDRDYYANSPGRNPKGPSSGEYRVLRGGSWYFNLTNNLRVANRNSLTPVSWSYYEGFRCGASLSD